MATPILEIGELVESQASKYITVNTALRKIEALTIRVLSQTNGGPPGSPSDGHAYIVDVASGAWSAFSGNDIAYYSNTSWYNISAFEGLHVWVNDDDGLYVYTGSAWSLIAGAGSSHARDHDIDATADHNGVSGATENNLISFDANGLPKDSSQAASDVHTQLHTINATADHTGVGGATEDNLVSFDTNGLPKDSSINPELIIKRLASVTVDLQAADPKTDIYTVPTGKSLVITHVIIRGATASLAAGVAFSLGTGASANTWKTGVDLSGMTGSTFVMVITQAIDTEYVMPVAADVFGIIPVTGATADAQATAELFGYLI